MMKNIKNISLVLLLTIIIMSIGSKVMAADNYISGVITVSGEGIVNLQPDLCEINFSTTVTDKNQKKAVSENAMKMDKLIRNFKSWGVKEEDIITESVYVGPIYDYGKDPIVLKHYRSENRIKVTVRDMKKIGEAIDYGIESGASSVSNLSYGSSNSQAAYNKALGLAVMDANEKSKALENALGVKVKGVIKVEETSNNQYNRPIMQEMAMGSSSKSDSSAPTPIQVENLEIRARLTVEYQY